MNERVSHTTWARTHVSLTSHLTANLLHVTFFATKRKVFVIIFSEHNAVKSQRNPCKNCGHAGLQIAAYSRFCTRNILTIFSWPLLADICMSYNVIPLTAYWQQTDIIMKEYWHHTDIILTAYWHHTDLTWCHTYIALTSYWHHFDILLTFHQCHAYITLTEYWQYADILLVSHK